MINSVLDGLICLKCKNTLGAQVTSPQSITCAHCGTQFPVVEGIPVLIDEDHSVFSNNDFLTGRSLFFDISKKGQWITKLVKWLPSLGGNNLGTKNFDRLEKMLVDKSRGQAPRVLVVGASIIGEGTEKFVNSTALNVIESDVSFGPRTRIIFDAHSIPYDAATFDCVVAQAVLEHVAEPIRCVDEMYRVLKPGGFIYAETPFMQQVHGGPYDFTRYTRSGHRKLFQRFTEVASGATAGAGTAFAWSYQYLLIALFGRSRSLQIVAKAFARITGFWLKYLDYFTRGNNRDEDAASGLYFLGEKTESAFSNKKLIGYYR